MFVYALYVIFYETNAAFNIETILKLLFPSSSSVSSRLMYFISLSDDITNSYQGERGGGPIEVNDTVLNNNALK